MNKFRQGGGTLAGIILGIALSLLVAVAVAVYVARIPMPFVNRASTTPSTPAIPQTDEQGNWNPNAALQGSRASTPGGSASSEVIPAPLPQTLDSDVADRELVAEPVAPAVTGIPREPAFVFEPEPDVDSMEEPAFVFETEPGADALAGFQDEAAADGDFQPQRGKVSQRRSDDALGELVASRTRTQPVTAAGSESGAAPATRTDAQGSGADSNRRDPFLYFVQAGAFRTAQDADAQRARLSLAGVRASVSQHEQAGRTVYRVRVGPFDERGQASSLQSRLSDDGFDAAMVRVQR